MSTWNWHTENPEYYSTDLIGPDGEVILQIYESHGGGQMPTPENAQIIASSVDTLSALEGLYRAILTNGLGSSASAIPDAMRAAKSAIETSRGGT